MSIPVQHSPSDTHLICTYFVTLIAISSVAYRPCRSFYGNPLHKVEARVDTRWKQADEIALRSRKIAKDPTKLPKPACGVDNIIPLKAGGAVVRKLIKQKSVVQKENDIENIQAVARSHIVKAVKRTVVAPKTKTAAAEQCSGRTDSVPATVSLHKHAIVNFRCDKICLN